MHLRDLEILKASKSQNPHYFVGLLRAQNFRTWNWWIAKAWICKSRPIGNIISSLCKVQRTSKNTIPKLAGAWRSANKLIPVMGNHESSALRFHLKLLFSPDDCSFLRLLAKGLHCHRALPFLCLYALILPRSVETVEFCLNQKWAGSSMHNSAQSQMLYRAVHILSRLQSHFPRNMQGLFFVITWQVSLCTSHAMPALVNRLHRLHLLDAIFFQAARCKPRTRQPDRSGHPLVVPHRCHRRRCSTPPPQPLH